MIRVCAGALALATSCAFALESVQTPAGPEGPAQTVYLPEKVPAPVVMLLSGSSGPATYDWIAADVARLGYYAVLLDGNDVFSRKQDGLGNLRRAIERAQRSAHAVPGKVAVVGFSLGGGSAIAFAAPMAERVSAVVAYYPSTNWTSDIGVVARRFKVPVLVLAGGQDTFNNCCLVESMRAMESAAKDANANFELVIYPDGKHSFIQTGTNYRRDYEQDAWKRTVEMLQRHQPLPGK